MTFAGSFKGSLPWRACLAGLLLMLVVPTQAADARDPWEGFNRAVFAFNEFLDRWFMKPVARGYRYVLPEVVDRSVSNVFGNLRDLAHVPNHLMQAEPRYAGDSLGRVIANTSFGLGGILDVATATGISRRPTDFGITLGKWGLGSGPYLVLPFSGPSTLRDGAAMPADYWFRPLPEPWTIVEHDATRWAAEVVSVVDMRAGLLDYEQAITGDRYSFLRDVYLQRRDFSVHGEVEEDPFLNEDF